MERIFIYTMFTRYIKYAFYCLFFFILASGELDGFKSHNTNECNIIDNEYCIHKPLKDDCTVTIISPFTCASQQNETSCDFFLDWSIINDNAVKFTLSKYNYQMNEWIALIFSNSNISNNDVNSDIIIALLPSTSTPRILNGIIKGSDVILIDDLQEADSSLFGYSEKKLLSDKISFGKNYVDIEFSFKYTSENSINLNKCSKDDPSKGFYMFLMSGKLDNKFNILFETATIPKIFGPFCLNSCSKDLSFLENKSPHNQSLNLKIQEKKQAIGKSEQTTSSELVSSRPTTKITSDIFTKILPTQPASIHSDTTLTTNLNSATNATTSTSTNIPTSIHVTSIETTAEIKSSSTTVAIEFFTTEVNKIQSITSSQNTDYESIQISTNDPVTFQDATQVTKQITTSAADSTKLSIDFCSGQVQNLSYVDLAFVYDHRVKTINYTVTFSLNFSFIRMGVFNRNPENNDETFLVIAEANRTFSSIYANKNESESITSSMDGNKVRFSIGREVVLSNGVFMGDCQYLIFYIGNDSEINRSKFITNPSENSVLISAAESVCFQSCSYIDRKKVEINLKFNVNNYLYHPDLENLNSEKTKNLSKNIIEIFKTALNDKFENFVIINILKANNRRGSWKRQIMADIIIIESKLTVWSQNSQKFTQNSVLKILSESTAFSHLYQINGFSIIENFSDKTSASIQTTTLKPIDTEYPKVFALALVFSLLVTVLVLGGALFAYHRWQKSKSSENGPNRGFRLAMPNRRANYQDQMLNLDSSGDNKFPNGSLDLEFTNPAYEENKVENDDLNFTDFTGSREMGIDIGTLEGPMSPKQPAMIEEISEKKDDLKHLRNILDECLKSESLDLNHDSSNARMNKLYRASNLENLRIQEDEINFEYFEEFRKNQHTQDARKDSMTKEKPDSIDEENSFDEKTESVANIFSTNIEQNLPELFGQYLDESKANHSEQMEKQLDQESLESVPKDSLNVSTDEPSEDEDFKPIDKNAFKNFRVESNNKFVIDESKSSFKEMIKLKKESTESGASSPKEFDHQALKDKENKIDMFKFLSGGIVEEELRNKTLKTEFSTPRVCTLKVASKKVSLGIHFCDSNMILDIDKNSPADLAGVKPGDKILFIDGVSVETWTCQDVKNKITQAVLNTYNDELTIVVMNAIEYNIFKSNQMFVANKSQDNFLEKNAVEESGAADQGHDPSVLKSLSETEFNPFEDIPNQMTTPFLHYSSIPPPETFRLVDTRERELDREDIRDDSLEESTSETISSCIDVNQKKDISHNNMNDFDFSSNYTSTTNINNDTHSNIIFDETCQFKMPWSSENSLSETTENTVKTMSAKNKKEF